MTGYTHTSSTFANAISRLNTAKLIQKQGSLIGANTDYAADYLIDESLVKNLDDFKSKLGAAEKKMYEAILSNSGFSLTREELSHRTGYSETSSTFANAISKLNTLKLIVKNGKLVSVNPEVLDL